MRSIIGLAILLCFAGCAAPRPRPEPAGDPGEGRELPLHMERVWGGWISCSQGYVMRNRECLAESEIPPGPEMVVSSLPSAGDGAPGTCPSGGCGSYVASSYRASYSSPAYGYGWSDGGWWLHSHRFRHRAFLFGEPRPFGRFHSFPDRRFHPAFAGAGFFAGSSLGVHQRSGRGGAWR